MQNEKRRHARYWAQSIRLYLKDAGLKERIKVINVSNSGLCFEMPKNVKTMKVGETVNLLFQVGSETSAFTAKIRWVSENIKKSDKYDVLRYGAENDQVTFTNPGLWQDYILFLTLKERFLYPNNT